MTNEHELPYNAPLAEAYAGFEQGAIRVRAGFRVEGEAVYAGGPIVLAFVVENVGAVDFFLAAGGERATYRPSFFAFEAVFDQGALAVGDPAHGHQDLGGPASAIQLEPGKDLTQPLFLNQFLSLETVHEALEEGARGVLTVTCKHPLPLAGDSEQAFQMEPDFFRVALSLSIPLERNDAALEQQLHALTDTLKASWSPYYSVELDRAVSQLTSLRIPMVELYLRSLDQHPNESIRMRVHRALALLEQPRNPG